MQKKNHICTQRESEGVRTRNFCTTPIELRRSCVLPEPTLLISDPNLNRQKGYGNNRMLVCDRPPPRSCVDHRICPKIFVPRGNNLIMILV